MSPECGLPAEVPFLVVNTICDPSGVSLLQPFVSGVWVPVRSVYISLFVLDVFSVSVFVF